MMLGVDVDPVLYYLGVASALKASLYYWWRTRTPSNAELVGYVRALQLYPLKSAAGVKVQHLDCDFEEGPHNGDITDRHWALVSADYKTLINYKQETKLSILRPLVKDGQLTITCPEVEPLHVTISEVTRNGKPITAGAYGTTVRGLDCGKKVADWLNLVFPGCDYRLVYCPPRFDSARSVPTGNRNWAAWLKNAKDTDMIAYQSVTPYHVLTEASVNDLNDRLSQPVGMNRFRPNIIINDAKPYDEDTWGQMFIGDTRFATSKLTGRCLFVNIDPDTGLSDPGEPLTTLQRYRNLVPEFGPVMGIHMVLERPGTIRVGDPVYIVRADNTVKPQG